MSTDPGARSSPIRLNELVRHAVIIAGARDITQLEAALTAEGFQVVALHNKLSDAEKQYARIVRTLLGHQKAWMHCKAAGQAAIVVEDDFVPVRGMGSLPAPINPEQLDSAWAWLYCSAPRLRRVNAAFQGEGRCGAPVATIIAPALATHLVRFAEAQLAKIDRYKFWGWDGFVAKLMEAKGFVTYLPYRNYGEHGGLPNPEHRQRGFASSHYADVLWAPLHFLPEYAEGSRLRYLGYRALGALKGWARLLSGRYLSVDALREMTPSEKRTSIWFAFRRLAGL